MPKTLNDVLSALKQVDGSGLQKQASAPVNPATRGTEKVAAAKNELLRAVQNASAGSVKTAGAPQSPNAAETLMKTAAALANAEEQALLKVAQLHGVAVADAFVARLRQHGMAAEKVASAQGVDDESIKLAMEQGYADGLAAVEQEKVAALQAQAANQGYATPEQEKLASAQQGYADTVAQVTKLASDCFTRGYQNTIRVLQTVAG
jgi:hypothetical protein